MITLLRDVIDRDEVFYQWGKEGPWMEGAPSSVTRSILSTSASSALIPGSLPGPAVVTPNPAPLPEPDSDIVWF